MPTNLIEAFELLVEAEQLAPRLEAAASALTQLPDLEAERVWLAAARERLASVLGTSFRPLLQRALRLAELESLKNGEPGRALQIAVAEQFERLQGGVTFAGEARGPLHDIVFHNLKVPPLRKCSRPELDKFLAELERRLATSYAVRVLASERYQVIAPTLQALRAATALWRSVFIEPALSDEEAAPLRDELLARAGTVERPLRQAKLLAQAALLPAAELLDWTGVLTPKAKRRGSDSHPMLEHDPPDPLLPSEDERAELTAAS